MGAAAEVDVAVAGEREIAGDTAMASVNEIAV